MVFDFRHKNIEGKWKSSGHRKGANRDAAFASLQEKFGPMPPGRYMSRPRDGRTKNWDLFTHQVEVAERVPSQGYPPAALRSPAPAGSAGSRPNSAASSS